MENYIYDFAAEYNFPQEATEEIIKAYGLLKDHALFASALENFYKDVETSVGTEDAAFSEMCKERGVHLFTGRIVFYICLFEDIKKEYEKLGVREIATVGCAEDIRNKMMDCFTVEKIWGISGSWIDFVFRLKTINLGRLGYNVGTYTGEPFTIGGRRVEEGDMFVNVHIPATGKPFDRAARIQSYEYAYHFYKKRFNGKEPLFRCESWLVSPRLRGVLSEKSNIISFLNEFRNVGDYSDTEGRNLWRIFGSDYKLPPKDLPRETSLQKAIADFLLQGNDLGIGIGFFVYDPVQKTTLI